MLFFSKTLEGHLFWFSPNDAILLFGKKNLLGVIVSLLETGDWIYP